MPLLLISIALFIPTLAMSGERAHPISLKFSPDGTQIAFVEWGVKDGSGFPFANAFLIDLQADAWLVALVGYECFSFEGYSLRHIAVSLPLGDGP